MATINVTRGLIGQEDISYGNGTFSRATSTGGTQDITKLSSGVEVYNVKDYGAKGDGVTDDTSAIQAAIDSIPTVADGPTGLSTGGVCVLPEGEYLISAKLTVPSLVSLQGEGKVRITTSTSGLARMIEVDSTIADGNRYGTISDIFLDGNSLAAIGLYVGLSVQRSYRRIAVENCADVACVVSAGQNNEFHSCDFEGNGTAGGTYSGGLRLNWGAGSNLFSRCELSSNLPYQVTIIENSTDTDAGWNQFGGNGPSGNLFVRCIFERPDDASGTNQIYQRAGRYNTFSASTISSTAQTAAFTAVRITREDTNTSYTRFVDCDNSGTAGQTTAFAVEDAFRTIIDNCFAENHTVWLSSDDGATTEVTPTNQHNATTDFLATESLTVDSLVRIGLSQYSLRFQPTTATDRVLGAQVSGDTAERFFVNANGLIEWGPGSGARDTSLFRASAVGVVGLRCETHMTFGNTASGVYAGTATPEGAVSANVGSIFLRTDGGAGTSLYVKESGSGITGWVAK